MLDETIDEWPDTVIVAFLKLILNKNIGQVMVFAGTCSGKPQYDILPRLVD